MFIDKYFEDFSLSECRTTTGRTITESDIVIHAGQTGDFYPHHMDAEWCKTQPFGQRIAHGTLTFAVAVGMTAGVINSKAMTYGYEKLRFPHPVFIGDTIRVNISISDKRDHPRNTKYGFVTEKLEVVNQRNECVMATQHVLLVEKRDLVD
ncbi:Bifunctional protein PaaZ [Klebsiella spallanzanii]|uniref:Bifunctional protein PaaZ n=1 Tax=Klebsiella spallanzanii TaxID=2587528 RepID=A0ABY6VEX8_9ENTR|nr:MaoC/PaaZ C-terminal domain-containing protein [Klebsiella spallanzanii]MDM4206358.1 MaoC/PaaZ C-terminal domain-containing protein [Klebsiella spallanzanii]VUS67560.1 Bifunctional protein PaaZ [Klebsiella spallanzanii]